ncbi:alpha/beta hydrolase [Actinomadura barringtoniae]|uniref:Alpha/beta hydrolase n=1 Tax=Actinomadura barringtoniae TaxID=1427535 RepID=A0A939PL29_9ACTN|nr:alpha/beta hydrolase [Actinomadura barringtoniae]MBO2450541.1 alpha/beta hydrolase [Actinomadura barringtoniae]
MASKQSEAVKKHWATTRQAASWPEDEKPDTESWGNLTAEPRGVDYVETEAAGLPAMWVTPKGAAQDRVLLFMHGGGFISGSMYSHRKMLGHLAKAIGARALVFDYHLAPEHRHPTQVNEAAAVYGWLLEQGVSAEHVAFVGDSAGGGMAITVQLRARELGLPLPGAAMLISPWVDMEVAGETYETNRDSDAFFTTDVVKALVDLFTDDPRHPLANALYGDLAGLGPIYIQMGGDEVLLADGHALEARAAKAGVEVRLDVFPEMQHTFQMAAGRAPEADDAIRRMGDWGRPRLGL